MAVKNQSVIEEIDFPRSHEGQKKGFEKSNRKADKLATNLEKENDRDGKDENETQNNRLCNLWKGRLTLQNIKPKTLVLACVKEIFFNRANLELCDGLDASLSIDDCGIEDENINMDSIVDVGQLLAVIIVKVDQTKKRIQVSSDPKLVNAHLTLGSIKPGLIVNTIITSEEDNGFICSIGLSNTYSFVEMKLAASSQRTLAIGQIRLMRIEKIASDSRFIKLNPVVNAEMPESPRYSKFDLLPGQIVPTFIKRLNDKGAIVRSTNNENLYIWLTRKSLPHSLDGLNKLNQLGTHFLSAIITYVDPVTNGAFVGASALPSLVNVDNAAYRRTLLVSPKTAIGAVIQGIVENVTPKNIVCMRVNIKDKREKLGKKERKEIKHDEMAYVTAYISRAHLAVKSDATSSQIQQIYSKNSKHAIRILNTRMFNQSVKGTCIAKILKAPFVSLKDARPGAHCSVQVERVVLQAGVVVRINVTDQLWIKAFIPIIHAFDEARKRNSDFFIQQHYKKGSKHHCRVLYQNPERLYLTLTARESLVKSSKTVIADYESVREGDCTDGLVIKLQDNNKGGALIGFYNRVRAWMPCTEVQASLSRIEEGSVIPVRIIDCLPSEQRMTVGLDDPNIDRSKIVDHSGAKRIIQLDQSTSLIDNKLPLIEDIKLTDTDEFYAVVESKMFGKASISSRHLDDCLEKPPISILAKGQYLPSEINTSCLLLSERPISPHQPVSMTLTTSQLIVQLMSKFQQPTSFEELEKNNWLVGVVVRQHPQLGYFIQFPTRCSEPKQLMALTDESSNELQLQLGQTVIARVTRIDLTRKRFSVNLLVKNCFPSLMPPRELTTQLLKQGAARLMLICKKNGMPIIGQHIKADITEILNHGLTCQFMYNNVNRDAVLVNDNLCGISKTKLNVGQSIFAIVINVNSNLTVQLCIDTDEHVYDLKRGKRHIDKSTVAIKTEFDDDDVKPEIKSELDDVKPDKQQLSPREENDGKQKVKARIVSMTLDYYVAMDKDAVLYLIPTRYHPNEFPGAHAAYKLRDLVELFPDKEIVPSKKYQQLVRFAYTTEGLAHLTQLEANIGDFDDVTLKTQRKAISAKNVMSKLRIGHRVTARVTGRIENIKRSSFAVLRTDTGGVDLYLHASQLPLAYLEKDRPLFEFVNEEKGKNVTGLIMFTANAGRKHSNRLLHLTMCDQKMNMKKTIIQNLKYTTRYTAGQEIVAFLRSDQVGTKSLELDVTPLHRGLIEKHNCTNLTNLQPHAILPCTILRINPSMRQLILTPYLKDSLKFELSASIPAKIIAVKPFINDSENDDQKVVNEHPLKVEIANGKKLSVHVTEVDNDLTIVLFKLLKMTRSMTLTVKYLNEQQASLRSEDRKNEERPTEAIVLSIRGCQLRAAMTSDLLAVFDISKQNKHRYRIGCVVGVTWEDEKPILDEKTAPKFDERMKTLMKIIRKKRRIVSSEQLDTTTLSAKRQCIKMIDNQRVDGHNISDCTYENVEDPGFDWQPTAFSTQKMLQVGKSLKRRISEESSRNNEIDNVTSNKDDDQSVEQKQQGNKLCSRFFFTKRQLENNSYNDFACENSVQIWIKLIQETLVNKRNLKETRQVIDQAIKAIDPRESDDRTAIYTVAMNAECREASFDDDGFDKYFNQALQQCEPFSIYKRALEILENYEQLEKADIILAQLHQSKIRQTEPVAMWTMTGEFYYRTGRPNQAHDTMQKALQQLSNALTGKTDQVVILTNYAKLALKYGEVERGKTMFEQLLQAHPRRTDLWIMFVNLVCKYDDPNQSRSLMAKACKSRQLGPHRMRTLYKKWIELEEKFGTEDSLQNALNAASQFVDKSEKKFNI